MDKTKEIIASMLKENTGTHFLDSGGAYGRHWERNQTREFEDEPASILKFNVWNEGKDWSVELTHNVYHWLIEKLEYNKEWDDHFHEFANREGNKDKYWLECLELYYDYLWELGYEISEKNSTTPTTVWIF